MAWIYVLKNKLNNKYYIGQTTNIIKRLKDHKKADERQYVHNSIRKYGWNNFEKFIFIVPEYLLDYFEIELIKNLNTIAPFGYNLETGGCKNKHLHEETKKKLSIANTGKIRTEEVKKNLSEKQKLNYSNKENHPWYGRNHKEETKNKISNSLLGNIPWNKNKTEVYSEGTKQKMSEARKGKYTGNKNPKAKKVVCLETKEIFNTIREASFAKNINEILICTCCKEKIKSAGGLHWSYYTEDMQLPTKEELEEIVKNEKEELHKKRRSCQKGIQAGIKSSRARKIICIETGEIYNYIKEAALRLNISRNGISNCCLGIYKTSGGFHWMYYSDYFKQQKDNQGVA